MHNFSDSIPSNIHYEISERGAEWERDNLLEILKTYKRTKLLGFNPERIERREIEDLASHPIYESVEDSESSESSDGL